MRYLLLALFLAVSAPARGDDIQVMIGGNSPRSMDAYRIDSVFYLSASDAGWLYQAQTYWRPMSSSVMLSLRGARVLLTADSDKAQIGKQILSLDHPMIVRTGQAFIPIDFFSSEAFEDASGYETRFNEDSKVLTVGRRVTVGPVQWFSFGDRSQIVMPIAPGLGFNAARRGRGGLRVEVPFGRADGSSRVTIGDGILRTVEVDQFPSLNPKIVRLNVELEPGIELWEKEVKDAPRRIVLNFFKSQGARDAYHSPVAPVAPASAVTMPAAPPNPVAAAPVTAPVAPPVVSSRDMRSETAGKEEGMPAATRRRRIVIDAGHGGKDRGTTGIHHTFEKDINLLVAKDLAQKLKDSGQFDVLMTRQDDTFVPLGVRSKMANDFQADLFVSLHCNNTNHAGERGFEIYFLSEKASDPESQRVADVENAVLALEGKSAEQDAAAQVLQAMAKTEFMNDASELAGLMTKELPREVDLKDRGVKQAGFYVLRGTNAPAVLVEMGFLSNQGDESRLTRKRFRSSFVDGLYDAILDFSQRHHWEAKR